MPIKRGKGPYKRLEDKGCAVDEGQVDTPDNGKRPDKGEILEHQTGKKPGEMEDNLENNQKLDCKNEVVGENPGNTASAIPKDGSPDQNGEQGKNQIQGTPSGPEASEKQKEMVNNPVTDVPGNKGQGRHVPGSDTASSRADVMIETGRKIPNTYVKGNAIPSLEVGPQDEQMVVNDNEEWEMFQEVDEDKMKNQILVKITHFRGFLLTTFQWRPYTGKWENNKRWWVPFSCCQAFILSLIALSFVFDGGWFCPVYTPMSLDWQFEITRLKNILWEARWFLGNAIGIWYFKTRHLEWFLGYISMPERIWRKFFTRAKWFLVFLMFTCIVMPTVIHACVINVLLEEKLPLWQQVVHLSGYVICRYTTFPVFLALISILHLLDLYIKVCGARIKYLLLNALCMRGPGDQKGAVENKEALTKAARDCMKMVGEMKHVTSKTENRVKYFMLFHLIMLLFTAFLGIFSYMERLEFEVKSKPMQNSTMEGLTNANRLILIRPHFNTTNRAEKRIQQTIQHLVKLKEATNVSPETPITDLIQVLNDTLSSISDFSQNQEQKISIVQTGTLSQSFSASLKEQVNRTRLFIQMGLDCMETALLYGLPLFLLIKIDTSVTSVKEGLVNLQARQATFTFDMTKEVWEVVNFMKTMSGIRIFGFQSTLFRTMILTFAGPILLSVVHSLLTYVNMPK